MRGSNQRPTGGTPRECRTRINGSSSERVTRNEIPGKESKVTRTRSGGRPIGGAIDLGRAAATAPPVFFNALAPCFRAFQIHSSIRPAGKMPALRTLRTPSPISHLPSPISELRSPNPSASQRLRGSKTLVKEHRAAVRRRRRRRSESGCRSSSAGSPTRSCDPETDHRQ